MSAVASVRRGLPAWVQLRAFWSDGPVVSSSTGFAFAVSFIWLVLYNTRFWSDTLAAMWHGNLASFGFLSSVAVVVLCVQALLILLLPRRAMVAATAVLFVVAAAASYFSQHYGVVMNKDMMRNVLQTDLAETEELVSLSLLWWVLLLGVVPAMLVLRVRLPKFSWRVALRQRAVAIVGTVSVCVLALLACSSSYAVYFREHKPIRFSLVPVAPVSTALQLLVQQRKDSKTPVVNVSGVAQRVGHPGEKPMLLVMVVGETARAANFQLGGYARATNPELSRQDGLVYFNQATSCGTATAISVPCMFSHLPRAEFDADKASRYTNLLDALQQAGFAVQWLDNNSGCKGVCQRVETVSYADHPDPPLCQRDYCYDEILLQGLREKLRTLTHDTVIVLHMIGSHGPAYAARYPKKFERFTPACGSNQLQRCSAEQIVNAYDNTILYTDHVIASAIRELQGSTDRVNSVLLYASDHGESLGEQGMYLHGLPYRFAPSTQTHIPMLLWVSRSYAAAQQLDMRCLAAKAPQPASHDNIYHTVLGAASVRNASYESAKDLFATCLSPRAAGHE